MTTILGALLICAAYIAIGMIIPIAFTRVYNKRSKDAITDPMIVVWMWPALIFIAIYSCIEHIVKKYSNIK